MADELDGGLFVFCPGGNYQGVVIGGLINLSVGSGRHGRDPHVSVRCEFVFVTRNVNDQPFGPRTFENKPGPTLGKQVSGLVHVKGFGAATRPDDVLVPLKPFDKSVVCHVNFSVLTNDISAVPPHNGHRPMSGIGHPGSTQRNSVGLPAVAIRQGANLFDGLGEFGECFGRLIRIEAGLFQQKSTIDHHDRTGIEWNRTGTTVKRHGIHGDFWIIRQFFFAPVLVQGLQPVSGELKLRYPPRNHGDNVGDVAGKNGRGGLVHCLIPLGGDVFQFDIRVFLLKRADTIGPARF